MSGGGRASGRAGGSSARAGGDPMRPFDKNLPSLEGTPKQVAWANDIRNKWIKNEFEPEQKNYQLSLKDLKEEEKAKASAELIRINEGLVSASKNDIQAARKILETKSAKTIIDMETRRNLSTVWEAVSRAIYDKKSDQEIRKIIESRAKW